MLKLGSHVGMSGKKMMLGSVEEALSYGANTFMLYTGAPQNTKRKDLSELNIDGLTTNEISAHLSVNRIIKLYPQKDTIVFVKPNQYRYWLSLTAYRDADKCFSDFSNAVF